MPSLPSSLVVPTLLFSGWLSTLAASEEFFTKIGVLGTPRPNQIFCDYLNAAAVNLGDDLFVLHRTDFERFGWDENLLLGTLNRRNGSLKSCLADGDFRPPGAGGPSTTEDPRLCWHKGKIWGFYTSTETGKRYDPRGFCLAQIEIDSEASNLKVCSVDRLHYPRARRLEKNWCPLSHGEDLFVVYSLFPCRVLKVDFAARHQHGLPVVDTYLTGRHYSPDGEKFFSNSTNFIRVEWKGTPYYLGMYHFFQQSHPRFFPAPSDKYPVFRNYFAGFIVLEGEPPFSVAYCPPPILDRIFDLRSRSRVVFPTSLWMEKDQVCCAAGINDRETWLISAGLEKIMTRCLDWPLFGGQPKWKWGEPWPGSRWPVAPIEEATKALSPDSLIWMDPS
jgi:hypothetical protein